MKTHFIENTNKQYSIRENGQIVRHYMHHNKAGIIYKLNILKQFKTYVNIYVNKKKIKLSINKELFKYFNKIKCFQCGKIETVKNYKFKCNLCLNYNITHRNKKWKNNNKEYLKILVNKHNANNITTISKNYVSSKLNLPISILSDDLYNTKKQQLLLHRQLKQLKDEHSRKHKN